MSTRSATSLRGGAFLLVAALIGIASYSHPLWAQELIPPTEASDTATIVQTTKSAVRGAYAIGVRPALRDAHAKGHGCVRADFQVLSSIPADLQHGVFASAKPYKAWIRFSNGAGTPHDDASGDGRGMAISRP